MGRRLGGVEEGLAGPHVVDVIDAEAGMLEQVRGLSVNLERILVIEEAGGRIAPPTRQSCITNDYAEVSSQIHDEAPDAEPRLPPQLCLR